MKDEMTTDELAALLGCSAETVRGLTRRHVLAKVGKSYPTAESVRRAMANLRASASAAGRPVAAGVAAERAGLIAVQRERAEFEFAKEREKWISEATHKEEMALLVRFIRSGLLALPNRLAGRAGLDHVTAGIVEEEVFAIMAEMAQGREPRMPAPGDPPPSQPPPGLGSPTP